MKLYRVMKVDPADGKPLVGTRGSMLGVRPTATGTANSSTVFDVTAAHETDLVHPGEGLSTSPDPNCNGRKPRRSEAVFEIETDDLSSELAPNPDKPNHVLLEPSRLLPLSDFQQVFVRYARLVAEVIIGEAKHAHA